MTVASETHTPGPWSVGAVGLAGGHISITTPEYGIAKVWDSPDGDREANHANARLIAAAPDLLSALAKIESMCPVTCDMTLAHDMADIARAAIAKATGGSDRGK